MENSFKDKKETTGAREKTEPGKRCGVMFCNNTNRDEVSTSFPPMNPFGASGLLLSWQRGMITGHRDLVIFAVHILRQTVMKEWMRNSQGLLRSLT